MYSLMIPLLSKLSSACKHPVVLFLGIILKTILFLYSILYTLYVHTQYWVTLNYFARNEMIEIIFCKISIFQIVGC